jgi:hypothetical protein
VNPWQYRRSPFCALYRLGSQGYCREARMVMESSTNSYSPQVRVSTEKKFFGVSLARPEPTRARKGGFH